MLAVAVIINNYLHDVATAVLLGTAVVMWALIKRARAGDPQDLATFRRALPTLSTFAKAAIAWIIIGGVPRLIFFSRFEWDPAATKGIVPALLVKHALMFAAVGFGAYMWSRAVRTLRDVGGETAGDRDD
ncbi:MAG: hypothetical protein Kow0056_12250 [Coriobacteriia bacterium]